MSIAVSEKCSTIHEKVDFLTGLFTYNPGAAHIHVPAATAVLDSNVAFGVGHPDGHGVATDMPVAFGGTETAPSPTWLLSAAVASCFGTVIAVRASEHDIRLTTLEVSVTADLDARGMLDVGDDVSAAAGFNIAVRIGGDGAPRELLREIVDWAAEHSPVVATVGAARHLVVEIETA